MRSKLIFSASIVAFLFVSPVWADYADPIHYKPKGATWAIDLGRSIEGIVEGILNLCGDGDAKAELIAVQEGTNQNADGTAGWDDNAVTATGTAGATALKNGVYSYVKSEILDQTDLSKYDKLQSALSAPTNVGNSQATCQSLNFASQKATETCMAVVNTLFADKGAENDQEYKKTILNQRQEYARQVTERHITLGYNVQQKVVEDLAAAAQAPVSSSSEIGSIAIDGQTLDEMLKIVVADVALQIEMMEADAVDFLMQQPVEIMPKDKPAEEQ